MNRAARAESLDQRALVPQRALNVNARGTGHPSRD
jgi:hypothetical protein